MFLQLKTRIYDLALIVFLTFCTVVAWHPVAMADTDTGREQCAPVSPDTSAMLYAADACQSVNVHLDTVLSSHIPHLESDGYYYIDVCPYDTLHLVAYGEYPDNDDSYHQSDATSDFRWDFGTQTFNGTNRTAVDFIIEPAQGYDVSVNVTDVMGCPAYVPYVFRVRTSKNPIHGVTPIPDICVNQSIEFTTDYDLSSIVRLEPVGSEHVTALAVPDTVFLPDGVDCGNGCSYTSFVTFTSFAPTATIQSANDILFVRLSIEHSYVGDIWIRLTCPNGQYVSLLKKYPTTNTPTECLSEIPESEIGWTFSGFPFQTPGYFLGNAYDYDGFFPVDPCDPDKNPMGKCWNYCWSDNTDQGYQYNPGNYVYSYLNHNGNSLDSTNVTQMRNLFHPDGSFDHLIGCPLNGSWSIEVMDGWEQDNGYVCGWELALDPDLLPQDWSYQVQVDTAYAIGHNADKLTAAPDTAGDFQYTVHVIDEYGCEYVSDDIALHVNPNTAVILHDTVQEDELPHWWNGVRFDDAGTKITTIPNTFGCDSVITMVLSVLHHIDTACQSVNVHLDTVLSSHIPHLESDGYYYIDVCPYDTLHLVAYGEYPENDRVYHQSDETSDFLWDFETQTFSGTNLTAVNFDFEPAHGYNATIDMTDCRGCPTQVPYTFRIRTSKNPILSVSQPDELCEGNSVDITVERGIENGGGGFTVNLDSVGDSQETSLGIAETVFLPDGQVCPPYGDSYRSCVTFSDFAPSATIQDVNDILYLRLNMEHSAVPDISIKLICPNGQVGLILPAYQEINWETNHTPRLHAFPGSSAHNKFLEMHLGHSYKPFSGDVSSCDSSLNPAGIGYNYVWSNNTEQNYQYANSPNSLIMEMDNIHEVNNYDYNGDLGHTVYIIDSSNVAGHSQFYHPYNSFESLIGCPLNGTWCIEVKDTWEDDNGYIFEWELAVDPSLVPHSWEYSVDVDSIYISGRGVHGFTATPDTAGNLQYTIHVIDEYGCEYTYDDIWLHVNPNTADTLYDTVVVNELPHMWNGVIFYDAGTEITTIPNTFGCDSVITMMLTVLHNDTILIDSTICINELPLLWNGITFTSAGTRSVTLTSRSGTDSLLIMTLHVNPIFDTLIRDQICEGDAYTRNGFNIKPYRTVNVDAVTATLTLPSAAGCDSTITLELSVTDTSLNIIPLANDFCDEFYTELTVHTSLPNFVWNNGETASTIAVTAPGTYSVTASDGDLCSARARYTVPNCDFVPYLPNTITPSDCNGLNDYFAIPEKQQNQITEFEINIFNRWGEHVFHSSDKTFKWYGDYNGKVIYNNIYTYYITYVGMSGKKLSVVGSILVL